MEIGTGVSDRILPLGGEPTLCSGSRSLPEAVALPSLLSQKKEFVTLKIRRLKIRRSVLSLAICSICSTIIRLGIAASSGEFGEMSEFE